jgi:uncharacterized protein (TIRG00374 family)
MRWWRSLPRSVRVAANLALSAGIVLFLLWQIDVGRTVELILDSNGLLVLAAFAVYLASTWGLAWRWQLLLACRGIHEPLRWLTSLYFIGYAAGQVLPTGIGGDALRIVEHARRRPTRRGEVAGAVLMERVIGAAGVLVMVAVGLFAAIGRYDGVQVLIWIELVCVAFVGAGFVLLFSLRVRRHLGFLAGVTRKLRIERPARALYEAMHAYRYGPRAIGVVLVVTVVMQFLRIVSIWLCGEAVGLDLSVIVYVILGPLLFLVMMVPFTINGLGVREAFFIAFLGRFGVDADAAFATGFLFYGISIAASAPGASILLWRSARPMVMRARTSERVKASQHQAD